MVIAGWSKALGGLGGNVGALAAGEFEVIWGTAWTCSGGLDEMERDMSVAMSLGIECGQG